MELVLAEAIELLSRTPSTIRSLLQDLSDVWLFSSEGPNTFTPYDVVGHLIHGEETDWMARVLMILADGQSRPFDPFDRFAFRGKCQGKSIGELIDRFETLRRQNLERLRQLDLCDSDLELKGMHPDFGSVTLRQLLATWAVHDLTHISQIVRVMAKQYEEAVGPWKVYLSILNRIPKDARHDR